MSTPSRRRRSGRSTPQRTIRPEPAIMDYTREYNYIRKDLIRIILWGGGLIAIMVLLYVLNIF